MTVEKFVDVEIPKELQLSQFSELRQTEEWWND